MNTHSNAKILLVGLLVSGIMNLLIVPMGSLAGEDMTGYQEIFSSMLQFDVSFVGSWVIHSIISAIVLLATVRSLRLEGIQPQQQGIIVGLTLYIVAHTFLIPLLGGDDVVMRSQLTISFFTHILFGVFVSNILENTID